MKITNVFKLIVGVLVITQLVSMGTPWPLIPYEHLDPHSPSKPRPPLAIPDGCDTLLSLGCKVTSSNPEEPIIGEFAYITDGIKTGSRDIYVELCLNKKFSWGTEWTRTNTALQWVQIDLGEEREIHAICIWHYNVNDSSSWERAYRDVICQISNDPKFIDGVVTVFNNDYDNSAGFGVGKDKEYIEGGPYPVLHGRPFAVNAVKGRYVRCYSNGHVINSGGTKNQIRPYNHYTEVEVYGRHIDREQEAMGETAYPPADTNGVTSDRIPVTGKLLFAGVIVIGGIVTAWHCFRRKQT